MVSFLLYGVRATSFYQCFAEYGQRFAANSGLYFYPFALDSRTQNGDDCGFYDFNTVPYFLYHLSLRSRGNPVSGRGMDTGPLFHHFDFAHDFGRGDSSFDFEYFVAGRAGPV